MERLARNLSDWLGAQFEWGDDDREIAAFSLALLISFGFTLALLLLLSSAIGALREALIMSLSSGILRSFAGGAHFSTGWRCGIVSALLATLAAWIAHSYGARAAGFTISFSPWIMVFLGLIVAWLMLRYSPVDVPEKPIASEERRRRLRHGAVITAFLWGVMWAVLLARASANPLGEAVLYSYWLASVFGVAWETFSVLPPGVRFVAWSDRKISHVSLFSERRVAQ